MDNVTTLTAKEEVEIRMFRINRKLTYKTNIIHAEEPDEYYKISVFVTFLDN